MILPIVKYGNQSLLVRSESVRDFDESLNTLVRNMFETMYSAWGVGLAAPQIGINRRIAVINTAPVATKDREKTEIVLINPSIISTSGEEITPEGCLSLPGCRTPVPRPTTVTIKAQDLTGKHFELTGEGLLARVFNHEIDHLQGLLYIHRISSLKRSLIIRQVQKLKRSKQWN